MNAFHVIVLITLVATAFAWVELIARASRLRRQAQAVTSAEDELVAVRAELSAARESLDEYRQHLDTLAQRFEKLRERQDQLELRDPETGTYVQAIRQVQRGATAEALVADCGLTQAEAELVIALHSKE